MIRRALLIGIAFVGVWFLWAMLPDMARSWKTPGLQPSEPDAGHGNGVPVS